jgi:hypothetical protein
LQPALERRTPALERAGDRLLGRLEDPRDLMRPEAEHVAQDQHRAHLPSGVLQAATEAFTHGLQVAAGTAAVLVATVAILAAVLLRGRAAAAPPHVRPAALQEC